MLTLFDHVDIIYSDIASCRIKESEDEESMVRYTLFCHPHHAGSKRAATLLRNRNYKFHLSDVSANGISSYILKDMGISELPALCVLSGYKYKVYEGLEEIEDFLSKGSR